MEKEKKKPKMTKGEKITFLFFSSLRDQKDKERIENK